MKHLFRQFSGCLLLAATAGGCLATGYQGESFPATNEVVLLPRNDAPPAGYVLMGRGWVAGEASGTTRRELEKRMISLAKKHGADAMVVMGTILVPDGRKVNDENDNVIEAGSDPDQTGTLVAFDQDVSSAGANGASTRFERKMYADFFRRETGGAARSSDGH